MWATYLLLVLAAYIVVGALFATYFLSRGVARLDHAAAAAPLFARMLWLPATIALWPFLLAKCLKSTHS